MLQVSRFAVTRWGARVACAVLTAAPTLAQEKKEDLPPWDVQSLERGGYDWIPWVFAFLFAAAVVAIAFKNPHRTHLD